MLLLDRTRHAFQPNYRKLLTRLPGLSTGPWLTVGRGDFQSWHKWVLFVVTISLLLGAFGAIFKSQIVRALPAAMEVAAPPVGILHFIDKGIDSWKPMNLASTIFHSPARNRLYEAILDFQVSGAQGMNGPLSEFADSRKFQYPITSLLYLELLDSIGLGTIPDLNTLDLIFFLGNILLILYLANRCFIASIGNAVAPRSGTNYPDRVLLSVLTLTAAITYYPNFMSLVYGNIQLWIDFLLTAAFVAWLSGRLFLVGILIALATAIKPQLGALLIWAVLWNQWSFCAGFLCAAIPVGLASLVHFGLHNNLAYLDLLSFLSQHGERFYLNESINGIVHRLIENGSPHALAGDIEGYAPYRPIAYTATLIAGVTFGLLALLPAILRRGETPTITDFALASICFTIGSPIVWPYHYGILLPAFVIALKGVVDEPASAGKSGIALTLGVSWVLCASYMPFFRLIYRSPWNLLSNPHFFGAVLLLLVLFRCGRAWQRHSPQARNKVGMWSPIAD
jgi:Glycosyltransferase family 87